MKAIYCITGLIAMILGGCSEQKEATTKPNVSVEREIKIEDKLLNKTTTWSMTLYPGMLFLSSRNL